MAIVRFDTLRSLSSASVIGIYTAIGTSVQHNWRAFRITNNTDADILISFDGINDNVFVPMSRFVLYDLSTNEPPTNDNDDLVIGLGTQLYAKLAGAAATTGNVYLEAMYAKGE